MNGDKRAREREEGRERRLDALFLKKGEKRTENRKQERKEMENFLPPPLSLLIASSVVWGEKKSKNY